MNGKPQGKLPMCVCLTTPLLTQSQSLELLPLNAQSSELTHPSEGADEAIDEDGADEGVDEEGANEGLDEGAGDGVARHESVF